MDKYSYIDKYFEGNLTDEENANFKIMLAEDQELAIALAYEKNVKKAIQLNERTHLKQQLHSFETSKKPFKWMYIAASIVILLGLFTWSLFFNSNYDALYSDYYQTYPNTVLPTVRGENSLGIKSDAFYAYDAADYQKSEALFAEIYSKDAADYALFYKGVCLMELKKYNEAIVVFNQHNYDKKDNFEPFFRWYSALAYLKLGQKENAIKALETLTKIDNPQKEMALKLLSELN